MRSNILENILPLALLSENVWSACVEAVRRNAYQTTIAMVRSMPGVMYEKVSDSARTRVAIASPVIAKVMKTGRCNYTMIWSSVFDRDRATTFARFLTALTRRCCRAEEIPRRVLQLARNYLGRESRPRRQLRQATLACELKF